MRPTPRECAQMTKDVTSKQGDRPRPRRGAIPTPRSDIDNSIPFIPDDQEPGGDDGRTQPTSPSNTDQKTSIGDKAKHSHPG